MASLRPPRASSGIPVRAMRRSVENSLTFGMFADEEEADFAREVRLRHLRLPRRRARLGASPRVGLGQLNDERGVLAPRLAGLWVMNAGNLGRARNVAQNIAASGCAGPRPASIRCSTAKKEE
jgi:hypothetical protein